MPTNRPKLLLIPSLMLALIPTGCDSKAPSKSNFKPVLQTMWDKYPKCANFYHEMPETVDAESPGVIAQYKPLVDAGFVTSIPTMTPYGRKALLYNIGGPNASAWVPSKIDPKYRSLCYAKVHVDEVTSFTEPGKGADVQSSAVSYTYSLTDVASWAKTPAMQRAFPDIKSELAQTTHVGNDQLVLTNNGWVRPGL